MSSKYYDILGVDKNASSEEIKKAYRKKAMQYHPDRASGDKKQAEKKFKEIGEAYDTLSDSNKRKNYDMFGSSKSNPFGGGSSYSSGGFSGFDDIFSSMGGGNRGSGKTSGFEFNFEDLFSGGQTKKTRQESRKPVSLDFEKTYEVAIFDFILGAKIEVRGVYGQTSMIKIPAGTKPGTKMRVKQLGKKQDNKVGNLIVKLDAKMPKYISEIDKNMLERIRDSIGY